MKKKILILTSNPRHDLRLDREIKDLNNIIKRSQNQSQFEMEFELEVHPEELQDLFLGQKPRIVHFCGHGTGEQGLVLQNQAGREQKVSTDALSNLFELFDKEVECVLLNACYSEVQAKAIVRHINYVIGMSHEIRDDAAIAFATGFYRALSWGKSIEESYKFGRNAIQIQIAQTNTSRSRSSRNAHRLQSAIASEHLKPVLEKKSPLTPFPESVTSAKLTNSSDEPDSFMQSDLTAEQIEMLKQEVIKKVKYKQYRDRARDTWDEFGQTSVTRQDLPKNEYRQRKTLLNKVKDFWIEGFLKPSLHGNNVINLDWKNSPNAVLNPFQTEDIPVELDESFDELQTTDILDRTGQGKTLLILGEPGSGKTIALLQLAKKAIEQTEQDLTKPIPVVFNLSSWGQKQQPIEKWLIEELKDKYQVPQTWSEPWIEQQQLILLLDGLDEVQAVKRDACVRALNQFITERNVTETVVCSRIKDYQALNERLQLSSAICIKPLSRTKLYQSLHQAGVSLAGLKTLLQQDKELEQFAQTPLILNIMSVAYRDWTIKDLLREFLSSGDRYRHLFDSYIERVLHHRESGTTKQSPNSAEYPQEKVLHWLSWLANKMVDESKIIFLIEKMQPTLLENQNEKRGYKRGNFLLGGLIGIITLLLIYSPIIFLIRDLIEWDDQKASLIENITVYPILWSIFGVIASSSKEITLFEQISWSWQKAKSRIISKVKISLIVGLIFGLLGAVTEGIKDLGLIFGLISGLIFGLIFFLPIIILNSGWNNTQVKQRTVPNQGIWSSRKNSIRIGVIALLLWGLILELFFVGIAGLSNGLGIGLLFGLILGLINGILNGGATCIQHFNLRRILHNKGCLPWNYARFLDYATERLLMKKVGGGYIFYHRMLMEHFAQRHQVSKSTVPVPVTSQTVVQSNTTTKVRSRNSNHTLPQPANPVLNRIVCHNCSHQNPVQGRFCTKCGTQLPP